MHSSSIEDLLRARGTWLKTGHSDPALAASRAEVTKAIAADYEAFEHIRDVLTGKLVVPEGDLERNRYAPLHRKLRVADLTGTNKAAQRYLTGGWLEELSYLAALAAGAEEALYSQVLGWEVKGYTGENEIDLIMRRGERLSFVSCKALRSELDVKDRKHRNRLMDAVHEADNIADHFGRDGESVAVVVTTDLFDELRNVPRYQALMGKAAVLDVRVIALEELHWDKLVLALAGLLKGSGAAHEGNQV